jgi:hypothetical protein
MNDDGRDDGFSIAGFAVRFLAALALVLLTYNPTRWSYVQWLRGALADGSAGAIHALAGVTLLIGWTVFLRTAWASLGALGILLGAALLAALTWVLVDFGVLALGSTATLTWVLLVCVAVLLAAGMSFGHWKRRASGQVEVDEVER